jgi:2,3-bisphosphoglycerate-dependent phosphoglycerate mutase
LPYWHEEIVPKIKDGKRVLIVAHGSTVRSLIKHLNSIPDDQIIDTNIPTGMLFDSENRSLTCHLLLHSVLAQGFPIVYEFDKDLQPIRYYYLSDEETVKQAIDRVIRQGKAAKTQTILGY